GSCPANFNPKTCWDEKERKFADSDPNNSQVNLPAGSSAFVYQTDSKGAAYDICATMESSYVQGTGSGSCGGAAGDTGSNNSYQVTESKDNHAPKFNGFALPIINSGLNFVGYIKAVDSDNDDIIWTFNFQPDFAPADQWVSWSGGLAPIVSNSPNKNERKIAAPKTGKRGSYVFTASISDGKASTTQVFTITVVNDGPVVLSSDREYIASTTNPFKTAFEVYDLVSDYPLGYTLSYAISNWVLPVVTFGQIDLNNPESRYKFSFAGTLATSTNNVAGNYLFSMIFSDQYEEPTNKDFNVKVINNSPVITTPLNCQQITRQATSYQVCQINATDQDGNLVNDYKLTQSTLGVGIDASGLIQGSPANIGIFPITIIATDEYGAISKPVSYDLHVNNYCGDSVRQSQNTEGKGGAIDNGQEQCDGTDNIALTPGDSSQNKQYDCTGGCSGFLDNCTGACVYIGGWCGDGFLQDGASGTLNREECDASITDAKQKCEGLKKYGVKDSDDTDLDCVTISNNIIGTGGINNLYSSMCDPAVCQFPAVGTVCYANKNYLGRGCYEGQTDPNDPNTGTGCKKGAYVCDNDQFVCGMDVFDPPKYDYCCKKLTEGATINPSVDFDGVSVITPSIYPAVTNPADPNQIVYPNDVVAGLVTLSTAHISSYTSNYYYTCDAVCKNRGKVCVGVGYPNVQTGNCSFVSHDMDPSNCYSSSNTAGTDCKKKFGYYSTGNYCWVNSTNTLKYYLGSTGCYCQ
ncbi:hypothetical protein L6270_02785, partial [Candidatus Parcubacteria bacterium]|nr:hypothetical protein [Patescibacteria group bacterium]MBU4308886.1 hypothetical protein [Patescibacteria group bacterium]MBU4432725.1 hypothetical protein [Patescibacteria group bacterium]MBU4577246.1 hypothetical protein [Patescibacteria group bacterium]MCG2696937.1 hypothetical protein [Candidatus Parcubacteria bacterium]